jgi:hypothetical protein
MITACVPTCARAAGEPLSEASTAITNSQLREKKKRFGFIANLH